MKILQKKFTTKKQWETIRNEIQNSNNCQLVMAFGNRFLLSDVSIFKDIQSEFPNANIVTCSSAGEIIDIEVFEESISLIAIEFEKTTIKSEVVSIKDSTNSYGAGKSLAEKFDTKDLINVMIISDGLKVNGSDLVNGLKENLPPNTIITGGLAGDDSRFEKTIVGLNSQPKEELIVAIGFYGNNLQITYGSVGGWDSFGPERLITKSKDNVLYELDAKPALDIYKNYLGDYAKDLPSSGLLFPLSIREEGSNNSLVRTILGINEDEKSLTFAGNMPKGSYARLMKANMDSLIEGASHAASDSLLKENNSKPDLAVLISCVGRKLVLDQRIEEEVEVIRALYGEKTAITGFYSYGEISPTLHFAECELHNQTMTITTFKEL